MRLHILRCTRCGAPVALADAPAVTCTSCNAPVEIPASYREAVATMRHDSEGRQEAQALYAKLGAPPRALRILGVAFDPSTALKPLEKSRVLLIRAVAWYYRWALFLFAPFLMLAVAIVLEVLVAKAIGAHYHVELETLTKVRRDLIEMPFPIIATVAGTIAGVYGRRKALDRARLQAALAARPPERTGGPSTCRLCGGPLTVDGTALGVRCVYCGADNLVALPQAWLAQVKGGSATLDQEITRAHRDLVAEQHRMRRSIVLRLGAIMLFLGTLLVITVVTGGEDERLDDSMPSWTRLATSPRPLGVRRTRVVRDRNVPSDGVAPLVFEHCPAVPPPSATQCNSTGCTLRLYAALRHGESATLTVAGAPDGTHVRIERHHGFPWPTSFDEPFGIVESDTPLAPDGTAAIAATWSAWHELAVVMPAASSPPSIGVCFALR